MILLIYETMLNKIIFTGGPGFGKSSVLKALEGDGITCIPEAPRQLLVEQSQLANGILPQKDFKTFAMLVLDRMVDQYKSSPPGLCIFDRGIPDIIAYLTYAGFEIAEEIKNIVHEHPYNSTILFFPPWKEIYETDGVRYESYDQARQIGEHLKTTYSKLGYQIIEVPKMSVEQRVRFVYQHFPSYS